MEKQKVVIQREIDYTERIMLDFLKSGLPSDKFIELCGLQPRRVKLIDEYGAKYSPELYARYYEEKNRRDFLQGLYIEGELQKLLCYLEDGIVVNGVIRPFNLIDYFILIDVDYKRLLTYSRLLESEEDQERVQSFYRWTNLYTKHYPSIAQRMLGTYFVYPGKVDLNGNVISERRVLTLEEKELILSYLASKNVPFNESTISEAFRLYANNLLEIPTPQELDFSR